MVIEHLGAAVAALAGAALLATLLAIWALLAVRNLHRENDRLAAAVEQLEQAMQSAANVLAESDRRLGGAFSQLQELTLRQGKYDAETSKAGFNQAIALSRRGAGVDELVNTCGVSRGEASLIHTMYGSGAASQAQVN